MPPYRDLTLEQKKDFLSYEIVIRDLGRIDEQTIREVFRRINLTKFQLDTVEIQNAIYDGEYIQAAKEVRDSVDLNIFGVFRESEFSRMADLHFCLLVMTIVEVNGYFAADREVDGHIEKFNDGYPNRGKAVSLTVGAINLIKELDLPYDTMWFRKSNFLTLVAEIALKRDFLRPDLRDRLLELESKVMAARGQTSDRFGEYYSYMYQNTNGRKARLVRSALFREFA